MFAKLHDRCIPIDQADGMSRHKNINNTWNLTEVGLGGKQPTWIGLSQWLKQAPERTGTLGPPNFPVSVPGPPKHVTGVLSLVHVLERYLRLQVVVPI